MMHAASRTAASSARRCSPCARRRGGSRRRRDRPAHPPASRRARRRDASGATTDLTADLFYRLLLGDVALQRGDPTLAARAYLDAARETHDARLARRATEIAIASRQRALAQDAAEALGSARPRAPSGRSSVLAALAAAQGRRHPRHRGRPTTCARASSACSPTRRSPDAASAKCSCSSTGCSRSRSDKRARARADPRPREAVSQDTRGAFRRRPRRVRRHGATTRRSQREAQRGKSIARSTLRPDWERAAMLKGEILAREVARRRRSQ